jgi:nucleoside 2-deoxyribosyltransferase
VALLRPIAASVEVGDDTRSPVSSEPCPRREVSLKTHIEQGFPEVTVERGDDNILTTTILEKIGKLIGQADVVIADCSGRNPNVFYELGMAHALGKRWC